MELNFASTFSPPVVDQVLARSSVFAIELTPIVNSTAPLIADGSSTFSAIWTPSYSVKKSEIFQSENRSTFFTRMQTIINVTISQSVFYVSNRQEPIARQIEIVFRNILFIFVALEAFHFAHMITKLVVTPIFRRIIAYWKRQKVKSNKIKENNPSDRNIYANEIALQTTPKPYPIVEKS